MSKKNPSILSLLLAFVMAISLCLSSAAIGEGNVDPSVSADLRAACEEGKDLWFGINGKPYDREAALESFRAAAEGGYADAYANLGTAYLYGTIAEKDEAEAVKWLEMAAEKGYPYRLAECYYNGEGVDCDYQKALALYQQTLYSNAANSYGANPAYQRIGYMYYEGLGVKYDEAEALKWYERGISDGDPACMIQTAYSYRNGIGTDADMGKAMALYEAAAKKGQTGYFLEIGDHICFINDRMCLSDIHRTEKQEWVAWRRMNG